MHRSPAKGMIRSKISTMPRQKAEAIAFLDIYKLVIEKKRLHDELKTIDLRRQQISQRIALLDRQVNQLETTIQTIRNHHSNDASTSE